MNPQDWMDLKELAGYWLKIVGFIGIAIAVMMSAGINGVN